MVKVIVSAKPIIVAGHLEGLRDVILRVNTVDGDYWLNLGTILHNGRNTFVAARLFGLVQVMVGFRYLSGTEWRVRFRVGFYDEIFVSPVSLFSEERIQITQDFGETEHLLHPLRNALRSPSDPYETRMIRRVRRDNPRSVAPNTALTPAETPMLTHSALSTESFNAMETEETPVSSSVAQGSELPGALALSDPGILTPTLAWVSMASSAVPTLTPDSVDISMSFSNMELSEPGMVRLILVDPPTPTPVASSTARTTGTQGV